MTDKRYGFVPDVGNVAWLVRPASGGGGFADLFGALRLRIENDRSVRLRLDTHSGQRNISGTVREAGRMIFVRGLIEQEGEVVVAFSETLRKAAAA